MKNYLLINNAKIIIPKRSLENQQYSVLRLVDKLIQEELVEIRGQTDDPEQLKDLFINIFSKFRFQYNLCLITPNQEIAFDLINNFDNYPSSHYEILIAYIDANNYTLKKWQDIMQNGNNNQININDKTLPPSVKTISNIKNEKDSGIKLLNASILLEYLLTSINKNLKSYNGGPMMLGERVEHYEHLFINVKDVKNALKIRNALVHAITDRDYTIQDINMAAQNLLYEINNILKHVSKQIADKILNNNQYLKIEDNPMPYNKYIKKENQNINKDDYYTGLDSNQNWTHIWKHVIPVGSDKEQMTGYQCVQLTNYNDEKSKTLWKRVINYLGDSDKNKTQYHFLVRVTKANPVVLDPKAFHTIQAGDPPKIGFKIIFSTQNIDKIIRAFMDDPMRQIVEEMLEYVKRECEQITNNEIYEKREVWEKELPLIGNNFSNKYDFGIIVESLRIDLPINKDKILKDEIEKQQRQLDFEKELARIDFEKNNHRSEYNNKLLTNEDKNKNIRDRINLLEQKKTELELEKIEDERKNIITDREHAQKYKNEMIKIYFEKLRSGEINFDEGSVKMRPIHGFRQDSDYSQITQSIETSNINSNAKMLDSTTITSNNHQRNNSWEDIDLQTERLPVAAKAFIPLKVKLGDTTKIIMRLKKTDEFNDEEHHEIAENWSARIKTTKILIGNDPLKRFKYNKKENAYDCRFEVSWNSYSYEINIEILDEDNDSIGEISSMPNRIN